MTRAVLLAIDAGVATIAFNRPHYLNALDGDMMTQFRAAAELTQKDPAVRAVVLRGEGKAFMSGGDLEVFQRHLDELPDLVMRWGRDLHFGMLALRRAGKPVIASVHGAVIGAGFSMMCAADLAIAADDTRFSLAYANVGASPDGGSSHFLPRLVGYKKAMELTLLPDQFDAATAQRLGLINWAVPAADLAQETARVVGRLVQGPTRAYAEAKRLLNQSLERSLETQMEEELQAFARCALTADLAEGLAAFMEKRRPKFSGR
jgi:2-(1,2-epoxy-1,2-dihydrophenyl)acetyl-CoA isomerase